MTITLATTPLEDAGARTVHLFEKDTGTRIARRGR
jgi:hypothetical protein